MAIYSDADRAARHTKAADEAYNVGPAASKDSYLKIQTIIDIAKQQHIDAIHPGYGFLAENADFADACAQANIIFIGPSSAAIRTMGSKALAKDKVTQCNVPTTPGYQGSDQSVKTLEKAAKKIGFPVLVKAVSGGGGKGMRLVNAIEELQDAVNSAKREAKASFNDDSVMLEKYLSPARHVEVQIVVDQQGHGVYLFDRDCSVQRRHQKIIEEAPAPNLSSELRAKMGECALQVAASVDYVGAGTVEYLLDNDNKFYFMEMNTRLQVEHPVTEMICGIDLVEWQINIAAGDNLPLQQQDIEINGHAIEVRVCAEDPDNNFMPAIGRLDYCHLPDGKHIRVDSGVHQGDRISPFYDSMIAKLICWGGGRDQARLNLIAALENTHIIGVKTNLQFLHQILSSESFSQAKLSTHFLEHNHFANQQTICSEVLAFAALAQLAEQQIHGRELAVHAHDCYSPWFNRDAWRANNFSAQQIFFWRDNETFKVTAVPQQSKHQLIINDHKFIARGFWQAQGSFKAWLNDRVYHVKIIPHKQAWHIFYQGQHLQLQRINPALDDEHMSVSEHSVLSPMPGTVVSLLVKAGDRVKQNDKLIVIEAMKMEHTLRAPHDGVIQSVACAQGDGVEEGVSLIEFEAPQQQS